MVHEYFSVDARIAWGSVVSFSYFFAIPLLDRNIMMDEL